MAWQSAEWRGSATDEDERRADAVRVVAGGSAHRVHRLGGPAVHRRRDERRGPPGPRTVERAGTTKLVAGRIGRRRVGAEAVHDAVSRGCEPRPVDSDWRAGPAQCGPWR